MLRFGEKKFWCVSMVTGKKLKNMEYVYSVVGAVVMRARHQHLDIRFNDGTERFRCMSSFVQGITNELVIKAPHIGVVFEPGTKRV